jgi:hypothetical protein
MNSLTWPGVSIRSCAVGCSITERSTVGDIRSLVPHQCLSGAVDPEEVQAVAGEEEGFPELAGDHHTVPSHVRALGLGVLGACGLVIR